MNALATLAHDCRRPELFRPQLLAAIEMVGHGDLDPNTTTGAWAGEVGQVQMLPRDIIAHGIDGDGDGHVDLKKNPRPTRSSPPPSISMAWAGAPASRGSRKWRCRRAISPMRNPASARA